MVAGLRSGLRLCPAAGHSGPDRLAPLGHAKHQERHPASSGALDGEPDPEVPSSAWADFAAMAMEPDRADACAPPAIRWTCRWLRPTTSHVCDRSDCRLAVRFDWVLRSPGIVSQCARPPRRDHRAGRGPSTRPWWPTRQPARMAIADGQGQSLGRMRESWAPPWSHPPLQAGDPGLRRPGRSSRSSTPRGSGRPPPSPTAAPTLPGPLPRPPAPTCGRWP